MKKNYKLIGYIDRKCELCDSKETLYVLDSKLSGKIIAICDSCRENNNIKWQ